MATIRLSNCTASFVSPEGLILTNHHCAASLPGRALDDGQEPGRATASSRGPASRSSSAATQIADVLMADGERHRQGHAATAGLDDKAANDARKKTLTQLEQACEQASRTAKSGPLKCEIGHALRGRPVLALQVPALHDVRLVFAPEDAIAAFGGDPDNFQFPRWCLDMSRAARLRDDGKPAATPDFLQVQLQRAAAPASRCSSPVIPARPTAC